MPDWLLKDLLLRNPPPQQPPSFSHPPAMSSVPALPLPSSPSSLSTTATTLRTGTGFIIGRQYALSDALSSVGWRAMLIASPLLRVQDSALERLSPSLSPLMCVVGAVLLGLGYADRQWPLIVAIKEHARLRRHLRILVALNSLLLAFGEVVKVCLWARWQMWGEREGERRMLRDRWNGIVLKGWDGLQRCTAAVGRCAFAPVRILGFAWVGDGKRQNVAAESEAETFGTED